MIAHDVELNVTDYPRVREMTHPTCSISKRIFIENRTSDRTYNGARPIKTSRARGHEFFYKLRICACEKERENPDILLLNKYSRASEERWLLVVNRAPILRRQIACKSASFFLSRFVEIFEIYAGHPFRRFEYKPDSQMVRTHTN